MEQPQVVIEIRPRLHICHMYYHVKENKNEEKDQQPYCLEAQSSSITMKCDLWEQTFVFDSVKIKPTIIQGLMQDEGNVITCRLQILAAIDESKEETTAKFVPSVVKDSPTQISCKHCHSDLLKEETRFTRILPLPTSDFDPGDLFCHTHGHEDLESKHCLYPRQYDFLYNNFSFRIHGDVLCGSKTMCESNAVYCRGCELRVGSKDRNAVKIWNFAVDFGPDNSLVTPEGDFVLLVKSCVHDSVSAMCKILITCQPAAGDKEYLLLWVMDRSLTLFVSCDGSNKLIKKNVIKLLYSHEKSDSKVVCEWKKNVNTNTFEIPDVMFTEGLDYLKRCNMLFPKSFRQANDMNVGYLGI
uniref:E3 ubiquitin-protein ligase E3D n=1 Tax=Homalodisca liturata TaxID=320908 RepID=A0A1B6IWT6_9HEMI